MSENPLSSPAIHDPDPATPVDPSAIRIGDLLPERRFTPTMAEMFLYSAVIWNPHRIHYDTPYVTDTEGYPGVLITGPLLGDWLLQAVTEWMGESGTLERYSFRNRKAAYLGETLTTGGSVVAFDPDSGEVVLGLQVRNASGDIIIPGEAVVRFSPGG